MTRRRCVAFLVDVVLLSLLLLAMGTMLAFARGPAIRFSSGANQPVSATFDEARLFVDTVSGIVLSASYFALSWSRFQATLGQRLLGLRVCASSNGKALSFPGAF
jgi:uncharacterized RDD family membrane protein YckC